MMETLVATKVEGSKGTSDTAEAAGELLRMRQSQATAARAEAGSDVGTVVSKAKRAASSLWLILHAQTCGLAGDQCPHTGCDDAKLILLHIKTCPAEGCSECPVGYKGCQQSRKLLDHYRKCRDMRARQAGSSSRRAQPHVCLVCSLVARQARNVLDGAKCTPAPTVAYKAASGSRKTMASFSLKQPPADSTVVVPKLDSDETKKDMPPPPPRAPNGTQPLPIPKTNNGGSYHEDAMNTCESPPSTYQLMRPGLAALAAAASPSMEKNRSTDPSTLGKSLDSSKISYLIDASKSDSDAASVLPRSLQTRRKLRAESVDVASVSRVTQQQTTDGEYDPTLETELTRETEVASIDAPKKTTRRRSASMGAAVHGSTPDVSYQSNGPCDTIAEESVTSDEPMFLMEEETDL